MKTKNQILILLLMLQVITATTLADNKSYKAKNITNPNITSVNTTNTIVTPKDQQTKHTLITRHSPKLNGSGRVEGSIRVLLAESFDINGNSRVVGDIFVPGSPQINASSSASYLGTIEGDGNEYPSTHIIKLRGSSTINRIVTRTDALKIDSIPSIAQPQGIRDLALIKGDNPGNFSTIKDLILTRKYNLALEVPEGNYGNFRAHGRSSFIFGRDNKETTYNLQSLELNTDTKLQIRGKVTINIKNSLTLNSNATMGKTNTLDLSVNMESGRATLNSDAEFYGLLNIPDGTLTLNSNSRLVGFVICDRSNFNSNSLLKGPSN